MKETNGKTIVTEIFKEMKREEKAEQWKDWKKEESKSKEEKFKKVQITWIRQRNT